jgi:predicted nucleotide-binding protein
MDKQEVIDGIEVLKLRLNDEVRGAYSGKGTDFAKERFAAWETALSNFFNNNCPTEKERFEKKRRSLYGSGQRDFESNENHFMRAYGRPYNAFIESLILDIKNDEYHFTPKNKEVKPVGSTAKAKSNKVFIVHGHNNEVKERTARFIHRLGFEPIILHEQASGGSTTIIEKILEYSDTTDFAIVLYTADDVGGIKETEHSALKPRARQNVVFEHGLLIGKLGRENVVPLVADDIEIPNDISGVVYVRDDWQKTIAKEMKKAGYEIDFNKLL